MTTDQTRRLSVAQAKLDWITIRLAEGRAVYLSTAYRSTRIENATHLAQITATKDGLFVKSGNRTLCYDGCKLSAI